MRCDSETMLKPHPGIEIVLGPGSVSEYAKPTTLPCATPASSNSAVFPASNQVIVRTGFPVFTRIDPVIPRDLCTSQW
jgi:hypothetical protein